MIDIASTGQVPVCMRDFRSRPYGVKVQTAFFRYRFMNLIFIFQKDIEVVIGEGH